MFPFLVAITFLTRLPLPLKRGVAPQDLGRSLRFYPVVGALVGLAMAGVRWLVWQGWQSPFLADVSALVFMIALTGGLHLDGLMDCCDGLFGGASRERALEIMKDSRIGAFAFLGGASDLLLRLALMGTLPPAILLQALALSCALGRFSLVYGLVLGSPARTGGLGRMFADHATRRELFWAIMIIVPFLAPGRGQVLLIGLVAVAFWWAMLKYFHRRLGGVTGDTLGAMNEATEILVLAGAGLIARFRPY